jgi:hypothetical protein
MGLFISSSQRSESGALAFGSAFASCARSILVALQTLSCFFKAFEILDRFHPQFKCGIFITHEKNLHNLTTISNTFRLNVEM